MSIILMILSCSILLAEADVNIKFTLRNYENINNLDNQLRKCESLNFLGDHCDPSFQFTAHSTNIYSEQRLILKREAGPFTNAISVKDVLQVSHKQRDFPSSIEIDLDIHDSDVDEDQRIARFKRQIPFFRKGQTELRMGADVRIELLIQIECAAEYYGERCEIYCQAMPGLWNCNQLTGARTCAKQCVHGSCSLTNTSAICLCASGWMGEHCKMPVDSGLLSSLHVPDESMDFMPGGSLEFNNDDDTVISPAVQIDSVEITSVAMTTPTSYVQTTIGMGEYEMTDDDDEEKETDLLHNNGTTLELHGEDVGNSTGDHLGGVLGYLGESKTVYLTALIALIALVVWIIVAAVVTLMCYRRRKLKSSTSHSGSIWTNASYDATHGFIRKPYSPDYSSYSHKYENTTSGRLSQESGSTTIESSLPCSIGSVRSTLPRLPPTFEKPPPVITGSKIRFAPTTTTVSISGPESADTGAGESMISNDPYEDMGGDYAIWEQDVPAKTPLTSFTHETAKP